MAHSDDTLTGPQAKFLAALLTAPTVAAACQESGCSERTGFRWLSEPAFSEACRAARREAVTQATARLQGAAGEAVEALRRNLTCGVPAVEVRAAATTLEIAVKAVELEDLAERLEALEQRLAAEPTKNGN